MKTVVLLILISASAFARCDSIAAASHGGWKPMSSAPRDGTVVEMIETYGVAPWYGIFKWTDEAISTDQNGNTVHFKTSKHWQQVDRNGGLTDGDVCVFWRPYESTGEYVDPTGGAQDSVTYWCAYMHVPYDPKTGYCKRN